MPELDMTPSTIEVPKYIKADLKTLAKASTQPGQPVKSMKLYLIELIGKEKRKVVK